MSWLSLASAVAGILKHIAGWLRRKSLERIGRDRAELAQRREADKIRDVSDEIERENAARSRADNIKWLRDFQKRHRN